MLSQQVYIVGHAAPGSDSGYTVDANNKYLGLVRRHARIIAGQFFGHLHVDTFRFIYDDGMYKNLYFGCFYCKGCL